MTMVIKPTLSLSLNGAVAIVDAPDGGLTVHTLPELTTLFHAPAEADLFNPKLSSAGRMLAVETNSRDLLLTDFSNEWRYPLPPRGRPMAITDRGDRLASLTMTARQGRENGLLELWDLPYADKPMAAVKVSLFDRHLVSANDDGSLIAVHSVSKRGHQGFLAVYQLGDDEQLTPLWIEEGADLQTLSVLLYNDWVWAIQAGGLQGWFRGQPIGVLPGTARERLIFSPDGSHLLVYRAEDFSDVTTADILFRLFDLTSLAEVMRVTHPVEDEHLTCFALMDDLSLLELRLNEGTQIEIKELGW